MKKLTTEEFIEKARKVHGEKYDYSKVEYKTSGELVTIICPKHGEFRKTPENHLHRTKPQGCPFCEKELARYNQSNTEEFIEKARKVHGDKYDYSKVEYVNNHTKVCIICPKHGEFWQIPQNHTKGQGCPKCRIDKITKLNSITVEEFIEKARRIHGDKYDYSKVEYVNNRTKVCIICPKHGEFWQTPDNHLQKRGCPKCANELLSRIKLTSWEKLLDKFHKIHGDKYEYIKSSYINTNHNIEIICPIHGTFYQTPHAHLSGQGCPKCNGGIKLTTEEFIEKAKNIHGDKYDYSRVEYENSTTKVCIMCPVHGEFWQTPRNHLDGCGCQICNESHLESEFKHIINELKIEYVAQYKFEWLGRQSLDFYLPEYNVAIECQGKQHFGLGGWDKGVNFRTDIKIRDIRKKQLCDEHGIKLFYFSHDKFDEFLGEKVWHNAEEMIEEIKKLR